MPVFAYKGYKNNGANVTGTLYAEGHKEAMAKVRELGLYPTIVKEQTSKRRFAFLKDEKTEIPTITRQLSTMITAGVPLVESLKSLADEASGQWKTILMTMRERVSSGATLSRAFEETGMFPEFYVNMVLAGEQSGTLDTMLLKLADYLEGRSRLESKVRTALIYPLFMLAVSVIVVSFLFVFVVPKIVNIFKNYKAALPISTRLLIFISNIFVDYWWLFIGLLIGALYYLKYLKKKNKKPFDALILRLPGNVVQTLYYGRFARMLGLLLSSGVPILKAMELSSKAIGNSIIEEKLTASARKVLEGGSLSTSVDVLPPTFIQLISTGEKTGKLPEVLEKAAESYEADFARRVDSALALLEPVMILTMGMIVFFIVISVLLPMFQLNQLIK